MTTLSARRQPLETGAIATKAWWFLDTLMVELSEPGRVPVVSEATLPEGASPPLHVHATLDDNLYVLQGCLVARVGEQVSVARAGSWVPCPAGVAHTFRVMGGPARFLQIHDNDVFLRFVHALGEPATACELPPPTSGPGIEELSKACAEHDITNVGPSMSEEEAQRLLEEFGG